MSLPAPRSTSSCERSPEPLLSSASRGWKGLLVELHHFAGVDWELPMPRHVVGIHVGGAVNLLQAREGRTWVKHVRPGDVTVSPRGAPKRFRHAGDNVVIVVRLEPEFLDAMARDECEVEPSRCELQEVPGRPDPHLLRIGKELVANLGPEGEGPRMRAEALAIEMGTHLVRHYTSAARLPARPMSPLSPRHLQRALAYIDANLREEISLAALARSLPMSPGHFAHAFKESTGVAPHRFIVARRMEMAKSLLRQTDLPITQIAHQVGCGSHSHFSVLFHRLTGVSPRDFRGIA